MRRKPTFLKLRALLTENDMTLTELGYFIHRSYSRLSDCMRGAAEWRLDEMYAILDLFHVSHDKLHEYFPKGGKAA